MPIGKNNSGSESRQAATSRHWVTVIVNTVLLPLLAEVFATSD